MIRRSKDALRVIREMRQLGFSQADIDLEVERMEELEARPWLTSRALAEDLVALFGQVNALRRALDALARTGRRPEVDPRFWAEVVEHVKHL